MSDAMLQELIRWSKDNKPKEEKGWSNSIFLSTGFLIGMFCVVLIVVLLFIWWKWGGKKEEQKGDIEQGNVKQKPAPDKRNVTTKYVTSDGKTVPKSQVVGK
jgi:hypothetical protein